MEVQEMVRILEEIARDDKYPSARVTAIRTLREIRAAEDEKEEAAVPSDFAELYQLEPRHRTKG